ncbi:MAG: histidinol dehydrogenase, partial [Alphaproteobacteria bacterium]|nr:histidinol dehydrogenase [Alphaproteobacteria bacterium]
MRRLSSSTADFASAFAALLAEKRETAADVSAAVAAIIAEVQARGDAALFDLTKRFDRFDLNAANLRVTDTDIAIAKAAVQPATLTALKHAAARIESFHARHKPADDRYTDAQGVTLGARWTPVDAAGLYVPGGLAAYPSSVLMNAVPARLAGVKP